MRSILKKVITGYFIFFAQAYLRRHKPIIVGVTGSVGKTTCREVLAHVLGNITTDKKIYSSSQNFNSELGLPLSFLCFEKSSLSPKFLLWQMGQALWRALFAKSMYDIIIAEYGIDQPGDMDILIRIAKPNYSVLTKLDYVHVENFSGGKNELWAEKWKLLYATKNALWYNLQDVYSQERITRLQIPAFSIFEKFIVSEQQIIGSSLGEIYQIHGVEIQSNIAGEEYQAYTQTALEIAQKLEYSLPKRLALQFELQPGRMSMFEQDGHVFIDSSYNGGPQSMKLLLQKCLMLQKNMYQRHGIILCLGDMRELGEISQYCHENLGASIPEIDALYTVGPQMRMYLIPEFEKSHPDTPFYSSLSSRDIGVKLKKYLKSQDQKYIILVKGGQNTIFMEEALMQILEKKFHALLPRQSEFWKEKKDTYFLKF